jgi:hypothetical protein
MSETGELFTYPEGWEEVLAALEFLPEEQRAFMLQALIILVAVMI